MEKFQKFLGLEYFFTKSANEIPKKTAEAISATGVDISAEGLIAACGVDQFGSRGLLWVVVTNERVVAKKNAALEQSYFKDITAIERSIIGDIVLLTPGNKSDLFTLLQMPHDKLLNLMYGIINTRWQTVRAESSSSAKALDSASGDIISQLERLASLKEKGILSAEEFNVQKQKLLAQS